MNDSPWYINVLEQIVHTAFSCLPAPSPTATQLRACKLVGHRGAHIGTPYLENSLPGFIAMAEAGVWGVETDLRWTKDLVPVLSHDPDCRRLFNNSLVIADTNFSVLRKEIPNICSLAEVIEQCGKSLHLMLEIKSEPYPDPSQQANILHDILASLTAVENYHLLALTPELFTYFPFACQESLVLVGTLNTRKASRAALQTTCGGFAGAYPFFTQSLRGAHQQLGQKIGTGHINSKRLLFQEIAKGTDWIFSNKVLQLQKILNQQRDGS